MNLEQNYLGFGAPSAQRDPNMAPQMTANVDQQSQDRPRVIVDCDDATPGKPCRRRG